MNESILNIILDAEKKGLTVFGVRKHHEQVNVGDELGVSYNTVDDCEPEELNGICCMTSSYDGFDEIDVDADLESVSAYGNDGDIILVGGITGEYGNDVGEIIIENAIVLHVFN